MGTAFAARRVRTMDLITGAQMSAARICLPGLGQ